MFKKAKPISYMGEKNTLYIDTGLAPADYALFQHENYGIDGKLWAELHFKVFRWGNHGL